MGDTDFGFTACGDKKGIIYWMGTKKGTGEWQNPSASSEVEVCVSSSGDGVPSAFVEHSFQDQVFQTKSEISSWVGVDLKTA
eukprot:gene12600-6280_t